MKNIFQIVLLVALAGLITSCEEWLDINDDPNFPTEAGVIELLPSAQVGVVFALSNHLNRIGADAVQHYVVQRYDGWAVDGSDVSNAWRFSLYAGGLQDLEDIIVRAGESEDWHWVGVAKLLKAYSFSMMVDVWDDIPYSEALNQEEYPYPNFDDAAGIYDDLFLLIDEGLADLDRENEISMAGVDLIYGGNVAAWKRMGNTLKLKMYNQIRLVDETRAQQGIEALVAAEAAAPGTVLITSAGQDFDFSFNDASSPENRHPIFQMDYVVKGEAYISNYFHDMMLNNADPRLDYYFYYQSGAFEGRNYGDPAPIGNDGDERTAPGVYPVGGKFNDGSVEGVDGTSAPGDGEFRMITNFMRLYIEAEAGLVMNAAVSDVPDSLFKAAMLASFQEVNLLPGIAAIPQDSIDSYVARKLADYVAAPTTAEKLEILMEEKYVAMFGNGVEAYNDYRRTGFPAIPPPIETNELELLRFPYSDDELTSNPSAPDAQPENNEPVFWDNN